MRPTARDVVHAAARMVGTPWRHQGRLPGVGLDCVGLLVAVSRSLGIEPHDFQEYGCPPDPRVLVREIRRGMDEVARRSEVVPGHALLFSLKLGGEPQHLGILTDSGTLIHALYLKRKEKNRVVEVSMDRKWWRLARGAFAFRGVNYGGGAWPRW